MDFVTSTWADPAFSTPTEIMVATVAAKILEKAERTGLAAIKQKI